MAEKIVRLVALIDDPLLGPRELGCIDGEALTIATTVDGELSVGNGLTGFFGGRPLPYCWEDLVPDYRPGDEDRIRLEIRIVDRED